MGIATACNNRDIQHAEPLPSNVCGDASDNVVTRGVVEDFTSHAFLLRQSEGLGKHVEIKYHWIRKHEHPKIEHSTAGLIYVKTADPSADTFTYRTLYPSTIPKK